MPMARALHAQAKRYHTVYPLSIPQGAFFVNLNKLKIIKMNFFVPESPKKTIEVSGLAP